MSNELKPCEQAQVLAKQVKAWTVERDRLNRLIAYATGAVSDQVVGAPTASNCGTCGAAVGERCRTLTDDQCDAGRHTAAAAPVCHTPFLRPEQKAARGPFLVSGDELAAPVSDDEPPLPETDVIYEDGKNEWGYTDHGSAYSADAVRKAQRDYHDHMLRKMVSGDVVAGYAQWLHATSVAPHSDDKRNQYDAFVAGAEWASAAKLAQARAAGADGGDSGCRMTGGICACRSGGSLGGCARERAYCCTNEPARAAAPSADDQHTRPACRNQGGICACRSGGSFGGCALERSAGARADEKEGQ